MALIYFLTTDPALARQELAEAGYMQIAINRWATPDRNDIRIITSRRDFQFIPGGTLILPGRDLAGLRRSIAAAEAGLREASKALAATLAERGKDGKAVEAAMTARDSAQRRLAAANEQLADALYIKKAVDDGMAQWIGNPLLGEDGTHDLIDGIGEAA